MNYIEQIKGFWIAQEAYQLGTSEIALYFYLLEVCNKTGWTGTFYRNNYKVMSDLSIKSYKTLQSVRDKLSNARVLVFVQKNGDANVCYTLSDLGKIYLGKGEGSGKGSGKGKGEGSGKVNINQTKPDQTSKSHSGVPPADPKRVVEPFWDSLVDNWFVFYGEKFKKEDGTPARPIFNETQAKLLKRILAHLKKLTSQEWTEEYSGHVLKRFLAKAYNHDDWMKNNFELGNLLTKFNSITNSNGSTTNRSTHNQGSRADNLRAGQDTAEQLLRERLGEFHDG